MTKKTLSFLSVMAALVLLPALAYSHCGRCGSATEKKPTSPKPKGERVAGTVKSIDAAKGTMVLLVGEGEAAKEVTMKVCPHATVMVDGKEAKLADVKAGTAVATCHVKSKSGTVVAKCIMVGDTTKCECKGCGDGKCAR